MEQYQAKSVDTKHFRLMKDGTEMGRLEYESWFSFKAEITLADHTRYAVQPKGFWGTTIEIKQQEQLLLDFKMDWKGQILIRTIFDGPEDYYILRQKGLFKSTFVLLHQEETELLQLEPDLKWSKMSYDYQITTTDGFAPLARKELLLLTAIHCANYYLTMMTAAVM